VGKRVMAYKPKETKAFEKKFGDYVKQEIINQNWIKPPKGKFVFMDTIFYFPRTDMDAQNYFKSICDIMTNVEVWEDDNIVCEKVNRIYYDSKNPRIEIVLYEADSVGIFDTAEEYEEFKKICNGCRRFKKTCSIHNGLLENRILDKVQLIEGKWLCNSYKENIIKETK
jgi:Holliday junction resolvase RusA-like endonuclease